MDEKVIEYIKENLENGYPLPEIHKKLSSSGVPDFVINESTIIAQQRVNPANKSSQSIFKAQSSAMQFPQQKQKKSRKWLWIIPIIIILLITAGIAAYIYL